MLRIEAESEGHERERAVAELWELGSIGIVETETGLRAFFDCDAPGAELAEWAARHCARIGREQPRDWEAVARAQWEPFEVGRLWYLVPDWMDTPAPSGRLRLSINPGLACGSGLHEATQLCLESLEDCVEAGTRMLDVGVGAGVLTAAGIMLGAAAVGCDTDAAAVAVSRSRLGSQPVRGIFVGSVDAVRTGWAVVAVANISASAVAGLCAELHRVLAPGGVLLASGFEVFESAAVTAALEEAGFAVRCTREKRGWVLLVCGKERSHNVE